jgi:hypothetical protein
LSGTCQGGILKRSRAGSTGKPSAPILLPPNHLPLLQQLPSLLLLLLLRAENA